jgi:hypothetical protein
MMTIFEFIGQLSFQNDVFKLQETFSEQSKETWKLPDTP